MRGFMQAALSVIGLAEMFAPRAMEEEGMGSMDPKANSNHDHDHGKNCRCGSRTSPPAAVVGDRFSYPSWVSASQLEQLRRCPNKKARRELVNTWKPGTYKTES